MSLGQATTEKLEYKHGIIQGNSLSALLYIFFGNLLPHHFHSRKQVFRWTTLAFWRTLTWLSRKWPYVIRLMLLPPTHLSCTHQKHYCISWAISRLSRKFRFNFGRSVMKCFERSTLGAPGESKCPSMTEVVALRKLRFFAELHWWMTVECSKLFLLRLLSKLSMVP